MGAADTVLAIGGLGALGAGAYYIAKKEGLFEDGFDGDGDDNGEDDENEAVLLLEIRDANGNKMKNTDVTIRSDASWYDSKTGSDGVAEFVWDDLELFRDQKNLEVEVAPEEQGDFSESLGLTAHEIIEEGRIEKVIHTTLSVLEVQVISESSDAPVSDVGIEISGTSDDGDEINLMEYTDSEGFATFVSVPKGTYDVVLMTEDKTYNDSITAPDSDTVIFSIAVNIDCEITIDVGNNTFDEAPDHDAYIEIDGPVQDSKTVGDDMTAKFTDIHEGMYSVTVGGAHLEERSKDMKLEEGEHTISTNIPMFEVYLEAKAKYTEDWLEGVDVSLKNRSKFGPYYEFDGSTDEEGSVLFADVPSNTLGILRAYIEGDKVFEDEFGKQDADTRLDYSLEIEGYAKYGDIRCTVLTPEGEPADAKVGLADFYDGSNSIDWVETDNDGVAVIEEIPVGEYDVTMTSNQGIDAPNKQVRVKKDETVDVLFETEYVEGEPGDITIIGDDVFNGSKITLGYGGDVVGEKEMNNNEATWTDMRPSTSTDEYVAFGKYQDTTYSTGRFKLPEGDAVTAEIQYDEGSVGEGDLEVHIIDQNDNDVVGVSVTVEKSEVYAQGDTNDDGKIYFEDVPAHNDIDVLIESDIIENKTVTVDIVDGETKNITERVESLIDKTRVTVTAESALGQLERFTATLHSSGETYSKSTMHGVIKADVPPGTYEATVSAPNHYDRTENVSISGEEMDLEFYLKAKDT